MKHTRHTCFQCEHMMKLLSSITPRQPLLLEPWTLISAPLAISARTFENLSLRHKPSWLILLAWIQSTGWRLLHDHRSCDLHSSCPNIASIMTSTKGISAYQVTDLPAILLWLVALLFFFIWCHVHAQWLFFIVSLLLFWLRSQWAPRGNCNNSEHPGDLWRYPWEIDLPKEMKPHWVHTPAVGQDTRC